MTLLDAKRETLCLDLVVTGIGQTTPPRIDAEIGERLSPNQTRRLDRLSQMMLVAALGAAAEARLDPPAGDRVGVVTGTGLGCVQKTSDYLDGIVTSGAAHADALTFPDTIDNAPAAHLSVALGCRGPSMTVTQREISGECALILAALLLRRGLVDAVVVAAGDTTTPRLDRALRRLAPRLRATEGAAALILETRDGAERRCVRAIGRLAGFAQAAAPMKGRHTRFPRPELLARSEQEALAMSDLAGRSGEGAVRLPRAPASDSGGWIMADGLLRSARALRTLSRDEAAAMVVSAAARGGTAAALVWAGEPGGR